MSIRRIKTNTGEIRWQVRVYENGRGSRQIGKRFERRTDAEAWLLEQKQKRAELAKNPFANISFEGRTFLVEAEYWMMNSEMRFSAGHIVKSKAIIKEFTEQFGNIAIERITPEFLSKYQLAEFHKGLKAATVNRKTEVITAILNHSVRHRRIPFSPATGFKKLVKATKEMDSWDQTEALDFLKTMSERYPENSAERWVYAVYLLALNTGLRAGEIWGLMPSDLNEAQNTIMVRRQFNRVALKFTPTKSKKPRVVPCNAGLMFELKNLIRKNKINNEDTIFRNEKGNPVCHDNFTDRRFIKDLKFWGGRPIRFHDMRHTATTLLIANHVDVKTVKEICGHSDITTTMNYVHLVSGAIEKVARTFSLLPEKAEVKQSLKLVK
jgi:integrase